MDLKRPMCAVGAFVVLGAAVADADVVCATPRNAVRVREACTSDQVRLEPMSLGLVPPTKVMMETSAGALLAPSPGATVATIKLPAGSYVLHGRVRLRNTGEEDEAAVCVFEGEGVSAIDTNGPIWLTSRWEIGSEQGVTLLDIATKTWATNPEVRVRCVGGSSIVAVNSVVVASSSALDGP